MKGFLVVLVDNAEYLENSPNTKYRGVDRLPPYSPYLEEDRAALEEYVFGAYKDEHGVVVSLEKARALLGLFRDSRRKFEIIYCESLDVGGSEHPPSGVSKLLGYDVAAPGGSFWSIVGDFPREPEMQVFLLNLNEFGLFAKAMDASAFLKEYCDRKLADYDSNLQVLKVHEVSETSHTAG